MDVQEVRIVSTFNTAFWSPWFWLPANLTWEDLEADKSTTYPQLYQIGYALLLAIFVSALRFIVERYIFMPLGLWCGLKPRTLVDSPNAVLEEAFLASKSANFTDSQIRGLAKQTDLSERQVERWINKRQAKDRPTALAKFSESGWRFTYHTTMTVYGFYVLWDKSWLWDVTQCWVHFPRQNLTWDIQVYYTVGLAYFFSLFISQFRDHRGKDFVQMFIHHVAAISLMALSWVSNLVRVGSLVLITHECADVFLEAAQMARHAHLQGMCDTFFVMFVVVWCFSRLYVFPFIVLSSIWQDAVNHFALFPAYYVLTGLLVTLLCLHIVWTYFIFKVIRRALFSGETLKDSRSDSEEDDDVSSSSEHSLNGSLPQVGTNSTTLRKRHN